MDFRKIHRQRLKLNSGREPAILLNMLASDDSLGLVSTASSSVRTLWEHSARMQKEQFQESSSSLPVVCHVLCHTSALGAAYPHWRPNFYFVGLCLCGGSKFTLHSMSSLYGLSLQYAEYRLCAGCVCLPLSPPQPGNANCSWAEISPQTSSVLYVE